MQYNIIIPFRTKSILSFWIIHQMSMQRESWIMFFSILQFFPYSFKWSFLDISKIFIFVFKNFVLAINILDQMLIK